MTLRERFKQNLKATAGEPQTATATAEPVAPAPEEIEPAQTASVPAMYDMESASGISGEIGPRDVTRPRLALIQQSSEPVNPELKFGDFALDRIYKLDYPCEVIFTAANKYYEENIPYGTGQIPRRANSIREVRQIDPDANLQWGPNREKPDWLDAADALMLVRVPTEMDAAFAKEIDIRGESRHYVLGVYTLRSTAYRVFQDLNGILAGRLRGKHISCATFVFNATQEKGKGNQFFKPNIRFLRDTEPELVAAISDWGLRRV